MKRIVSSILLIAVLLASPYSYATSTPTTTPGGTTTPTTTPSTTGGTTTPGSGSQTCDFTALKDSLRGTESSNGQCGYNKSASTKYGLTAGRYQFIPPTYASMVKNCPGAAQCDHNQVRIGNKACCATEDCAMDNLLASNMAAIKKKATCQQILGKTIKSPKYGSCTVTMSGILAAWHLGGNNACDGAARGGYGDSDGHTTEADYLCKHSGKAVPEDCTPAQQGDPDAGGPVGTIEQIQSQEAQGQLIITGPADPLKEWWVAALQLMAEQFTVNMMMQVEGIGLLLDAKHQLESQRLFQQKMTEAHKDYQPSEQVCTFSTFAKDLSATQRAADVTKLAVSNEILQRELGSGDTKGITSNADALSRVAQFRTRFCNPQDSNGGLKLLCPTAAPAEMQNRDINYTQTLDMPLSLDINMTDSKTTPDEEAVFALVDNLFMNDVPVRPGASSLEMSKFQYHYLNYRSIVAMRGIARNTMANIIALKTQTPVEAGVGGSAPYMRRLLLEFGLPQTEIDKMLGESPSYYAQMEILTKKIYQNPTFYTALYDKPANVKRIRAAMQAVKLMQDRDIQAALQRREMLLSIMLELRLREKSEEVYNATDKAIYDER